ncbi:tryptophan--tRNA ligase [Thermoproteota archaeon]
MKKRIVSGIQPTGQMHLGNYLGAVSNWIALQDTYDSYFFIADLHALTSVYENPSSLKQDKFNLALDLLAAGLDPEKGGVFFQSDVPEHSELHALLSMITPLPWLMRVPTYKDKQNELKEKHLDTYGFLGYPVLQAADILIYKADAVPVGRDQLPHLELTREIARRFNHFYGQVFTEPADIVTKTPLLPGTDGRKMSKSYNNTIPISEPSEALQKRVMSMFTDPARQRKNDPGHPDQCPVFAYHQIYNSKERQTAIEHDCKKGAIGCVECKREFAILLDNSLADFRERRDTLMKSPDMIYEVLLCGAKRARNVARKTLEQVKQAINL